MTWFEVFLIIGGGFVLVGSSILIGTARANVRCGKSKRND